MSSNESHPVKVYLYDISKGMAKALSPTILGKRLDGVWHTGVVVYGEEYFFGGMGGIEKCSVGGTILGDPDTVLDMGKTHIPKRMFLDYLEELSAGAYGPDKYHLLEHNCNNFTADAIQFLTGKSIPSYITELPQEFLNTPLGAMIKPLIDNMSVQPTGGQSVFPKSGNSSRNASAVLYNDFPSQGDFLGVNRDEWSCQADVVCEKNNDDCSAKPVVFKPDDGFLEQCMKSQTQENCFPPGDTEMWQEVKEYLCVAECSFSLSRSHLHIIENAITSGEVSVDKKVCTCQLLQLLVLKDDFLSLLSHDPSHMIYTLLVCFGEQPLPVKTCLVKVLTNCCSTERGRVVLSDVGSAEAAESTPEHRVCHMCTSCLLDETSAELKEAGAGLTLNLSLSKVDYETELELGSALTHCLQQPLPTENTTLYCLLSLLQFTQKNAEIRDLAGVMSIAWSEHSNLSPRIKNICVKLQTQISQ